MKHSKEQISNINDCYADLVAVSFKRNIYVISPFKIKAESESNPRSF